MGKLEDAKQELLVRRDAGTCEGCKHFAIGPDAGSHQHNDLLHGLCLKAGTVGSGCVPVRFTVPENSHQWPYPDRDAKTALYVQRSFGCKNFEAQSSLGICPKCEDAIKKPVRCSTLPECKRKNHSDRTIVTIVDFVGLNVRIVIIRPKMIPDLC